MLFHADPDLQHRHCTKKNLTSCLIQILEEQVPDPSGDGILHHHELWGDGRVGGGDEHTQDQAGFLPTLGYCAGGQGTTQEAPDGQARAGQAIRWSNPSLEPRQGRIKEVISWLITKFI